MTALVFTAGCFFFLMPALLLSGGVAYPTRPQNCWSCATGNQCINFDWRCDGDNDCSDSSDEAGCTNATSISCVDHNMWGCASGQCIQNRWRCDGENDCPDASDEEGCPLNSTCPKGKFRCSSGQCIDDTWRCDNQRDCQDGSDEADCSQNSTVCNDGEWQCESGQCVAQRWRCDGERDCSDGSDENGCSEQEMTCRGTDWKCDNQCVPRAWKCDGEVDCVDQSDESGCNITITNNNTTYANYSHSNNVTSTSTNNSTLSCDPVYAWVCGEGDKQQCVPITWRCDGDIDCEGGEDEEGCGGDNHTTVSVSVTGQSSCDSATHWACPNSNVTTPICIEKDLHCDGVEHCPDGADELNCTPQDNFTASQWKCSGQPVQWVPLSFRCDGRPDCRDSSDERNCHSFETNQIV